MRVLVGIVRLTYGTSLWIDGLSEFVCEREARGLTMR